MQNKKAERHRGDTILLSLIPQRRQQFFAIALFPRGEMMRLDHKSRARFGVARPTRVSENAFFIRRSCEPLVALWASQGQRLRWVFRHPFGDGIVLYACFRHITSIKNMSWKRKQALEFPQGLVCCIVCLGDQFALTLQYDKRGLEVRRL